MNICVVGGAGYIGSHAVKLLIERGHAVICIDNLSNGHRQSVHSRAKFYATDMALTAQVIDIFQKEKVEAVMHFAACAYVGESVTDPRKYYRNNVSNTVSMLDAMHACGIRKLVFSSTCATYGMPPRMPITEDLPQNPINTYA